MSAIIRGGTSGVDADVDASKNLLVAEGLAAVPAAGGFYTVAGQTTAVVAATLAANTNLMAMRFSPSSSRQAYVTRLRCLIGVAAVGASAAIAGTLGLQRFTVNTPTGGNARTVSRMDEAAGSASDMTDVRDSNAALTGTAPTWGSVVAVTLVPIFIASGAMWMEWIVEPPRPIRLTAGDGLGLRTQVVMPGTQTWMYSYTFHWYEK